MTNTVDSPKAARPSDVVWGVGIFVAFCALVAFTTTL
jgi:hypothetical protein